MSQWMSWVWPPLSGCGRRRRPGSAHDVRATRNAANGRTAFTENGFGIFQSKMLSCTASRSSRRRAGARPACAR